MQLNFAEQVSQYGIDASILTLIVGAIVVPIIRSMLQQSKRHSDLLQKALEDNSKVVDHLKEMEAGSVRSRQALAETQTEILASLRNLEYTLALRERREGRIQ